MGKHHVSGRYFFTNFNEPATPLGTNILALNANANRVRVQTISLNDDYTVSPHLLLNTWFGWNQQNGGYIASTPFSANPLGVNIAPSPSPQIDITIGGYFSALSANVGAYNRGDMTLREVATAVLGKHQIAFGGELLRVRAPIYTLNVVNFANPFGSAGDKLLNGWELAPILVWQSGLPHSIMSGLDNSFTGDYSDRADFIGRMPLSGRFSALLGARGLCSLHSNFCSRAVPIHAVGRSGFTF